MEGKFVFILLISVVLSIAMMPMGVNASTRSMQTLKKGSKKDDKTKKPKKKSKDKVKHKNNKTKKDGKKKKKGSKKKGNFDITLLNMNPNADNSTVLYDMAFIEAKEKWEQIIIGDLRDLPFKKSPSDIFGGRFVNRLGAKKVKMAVDDVVIGYSIQEIDGAGKILGQAGPIYYRLRFEPDKEMNMIPKYSSVSG